MITGIVVLKVSLYRIVVLRVGIAIHAFVPACIVCPYVHRFGAETLGALAFVLASLVPRPQQPPDELRVYAGAASDADTI